MSDAPEFTAKTLEGEEKNKPKKTLASRKKTARSNTREINRAITSIYQDDQGRLPNMKKIQIKKSHPFLKFLFTVLILGGLLAATAWVGFFVLPSGNKFSESNLDFNIAGPKTLNLNATSTYTITIYNHQNISIKNVVLSMRYPAGFVFLESSQAAQNAGHNEWDLGEITSNKKMVLTISGKNYGAPASTQSWRGLLTYQPSNLNSTLQKTAILNTVFGSSLQIISAGPDKATIGTEVEYNFSVQASKDWQPDKLDLALILPSNFSITSSTPVLNKNRWLIELNGPSSTPLSNLKLSVRGKFSDGGTDSAVLKSILYLPVKELNQNVEVANSELTTAIAKNSLAFTVAINGTLKNFSTHPGEMLNISLNIKNSSAGDISKATVKFTMTGPAIGKQTLIEWAAITDASDGDIQGKQISGAIRQGEIIWDSKKIPALAKIKAGGEVNIDFSLPIKGADKISLADIKETKIAVASNLAYTDAAGAEDSLSGNPIDITLNSDLNFEMRHSVDSSGGAEKHDIKWILNNTFHPLKNIKLTADVYGDITWNGGQAPAGELKYDETKKTATWIVPEMPDSVDVLALPFSLTLNKKDPTQNLLIGKVHITAEDTVTGETIDFMADGINLL